MRRATARYEAPLVCFARLSPPRSKLLRGALGGNVNRMSLSGRFQSFGYAMRGIVVMLQTQHNAWLHAIASALVLFAGFALEVSNTEWQIIVLAFVAVWAAEAMNTALEFLCDVASTEHHPLVEKAKDVAAGGVLLSALGAAVIGLFIFVPKLLALVGHS